MKTEKKVVSLHQFSCYGDKLRQKVLNRLIAKNSNMITAEKSLSKTDHTHFVCEMASSITVPSNQLSSEIPSNVINNCATEVVSTGRVLFWK